MGFFLWCNILLAYTINLEDSKLNPEENNSIESSPNFNKDNKEQENPVVYLSNLVKKLDVKNRNGLVALAIVNLLVILLFKFYLKGSGLLS